MEAWLGPAAGTAARRPGGHFGRRNSRYPNSSENLSRQPFISLSSALSLPVGGMGEVEGGTYGAKGAVKFLNMSVPLCLNFVT